MHLKVRMAGTLRVVPIGGASGPPAIPYTFQVISVNCLFRLLAMAGELISQEPDIYRNLCQSESGA